jgi:sugar phosphate isomerase/epimerase
MLEHCSVGAFLNITDDDASGWRKQLRQLDRLSVGHVEIWLERDIGWRQLVDLKSILDGRRSIMHGPFVGMSFATDWDELAAISLDRCHRAIEAAGVLGSEILTLHAGTYGAHGSHADALQRVAMRLERFRAIGHPKLSIENLPRRRGASVEAVTFERDLDALAEYAPDIRYTIDVGHCLQNREDPVAVLERQHQRVGNIHLHDGNLSAGAHLGLGDGDLDLADLLSALDRLAYDGFLTVEVLDLDDLVHSLEVLRSYGIGSKAAYSTAA